MLSYQTYYEKNIQSLPKYRQYLKNIYDKKYYNLLKKIYDQGQYIKIGTDCSGLDTPIYAMKSLSLPIKHIFSCDNDLHVKETINCNFKPQIFYNDIFSRNYDDIPPIDWYVAGFPCQTFSSMGDRKGFFDKDNKGVIFYACLETIKKKQPSVIILENVPGLLTHEKGQTFKIIMDELKKLKVYTIYHQVLNTNDFDLPQSRNRIYIVLIRSDKLKKPFKFPQPIQLTPKTNIDDIIEKPIKSIDKKTLEQLTDHKKIVLNDLAKKIDLKEHWVVNLNVSSAKRASAKKNMSPCLFATSGRFYLTWLKRQMTPREYLRLQGFGDDFNMCVSKSQIYHQAGNSMSVNVLCYLIVSILESLY
ncbi:MAG TPA: DNA (cytosine-5-)-methyltransferase [Candidatus Babeliales bacterium]|jgi:DNA (cytosine-5)-methyltransferase 1|nr:DNA (cytosine-5-)-methyltransferase [Candidatus Babeliales bacterium]